MIWWMISGQPFYRSSTDGLDPLSRKVLLTYRFRSCSVPGSALVVDGECLQPRSAQIDPERYLDVHYGGTQSARACAGGRHFLILGRVTDVLGDGFQRVSGGGRHLHIFPALAAQRTVCAAGAVHWPFGAWGGLLDHAPGRFARCPGFRKPPAASRTGITASASLSFLRTKWALWRRISTGWRWRWRPTWTLFGNGTSGRSSLSARSPTS